MCIMFLSAGCNFFSTTLPAGIIKTVNGGTDWQFSNAAKDNPNASMAGQNISKMDFDPQNRQTVFASSYNGGLFKSEDSGESWKSILTNIFVYDFYIVPEDPKIIYAAGFYNDHGRVLKTTDGGASWNQIYNEASSGNAVRSISQNPNNGAEMVIGTTSGTVIKSTDGGANWLLLKDFKEQVNKVSWEQKGIYVLLKTKGLQVSFDFGQNFTGASSKLVNNYNITDFNYTSEAVANFSQMYVHKSDENLIYLTTNKGLYKTTDGGKTWQKVGLPVTTENTAARAITVNQFNPSIVLTSINATIYKSVDGGSTWQTQGINNAGGFVNYLLVDPELAQIVYGGIYAVEE